MKTYGTAQGGKSNKRETCDKISKIRFPQKSKTHIDYQWVTKLASPLWDGIESLTILRATFDDIADLTGLDAAVNLTWLDLRYNQISEIGALSGLTHLRWLYLDHNLLHIGESSPALAVIENLQNGGTSVTFEPQNLDLFLGQPIDGFPGWMASPWYLNYNVEFWPWIYHDEHEWQFVSENSTVEAIFLYDLGLQDWLFLNANTYRWQYLFGDAPGWIWTFGDNAPGRRFFQRLDDESIFSVPADLPVD